MRWGPMRPQITLALKKTRPPGQVKWLGCVELQMPAMLFKALEVKVSGSLLVRVEIG